jgi:hsp70-interacting protein
MSAQPEDNWAWLGLLKWSLTYVDGTVPSEESPNYKEMSTEDKKFLEEVMKDGIINEGERMKTILNHLVTYLGAIKASDDSVKGVGEDTLTLLGQEEKSDSLPAAASAIERPSSTQEIKQLLEELQDIVEQIDFARSFMALGGMPFLLGCAAQTNTVPQPIRAHCLAVLGTLNQNNPPVQYKMLEEGNIPKLINIYFAEYLVDNSCTEIQARALQAMSCSIREHEMAERIFCMNQEGRKMIESALGLYSHALEGTQNSSKQPLPTPSDAMRRKALFFLQALVTSDSADSARIALFANAIRYVATRFVDSADESNLDIRETALSMLTRILDQNKDVNAVLDAKQYLVGLGIKRVSELRKVDGDEKDSIKEELSLLEMLISQLARAVP